MTNQAENPITIRSARRPGRRARGALAAIALLTAGCGGANEALNTSASHAVSSAGPARPARGSTPPTTPVTPSTTQPSPNTAVESTPTATATATTANGTINLCSIPRSVFEKAMSAESKNYASALACSPVPREKDMPEYDGLIVPSAPNSLGFAEFGGPEFSSDEVFISVFKDDASQGSEIFCEDIHQRSDPSYHSKLISIDGYPGMYVPAYEQAEPGLTVEEAYVKVGNDLAEIAVEQTLDLANPPQSSTIALAKAVAQMLPPAETNLSC